MTKERDAPGAGLAAAASLAFAAVALSYLPGGHFLRYAALGVSGTAARTVLVAAGAVLAALAHERAVRGTIYEILRDRLPAGVAGPTTALCGVVLPLAARLLLLPSGRAPAPVVVGHAFLVEFALSLALCWLALGTGSTLPGAAGLAVLWIVRLTVTAAFRGGVLPMLELIAAILAAAAVALVLRGPLAPHRDAVMEEP